MLKNGVQIKNLETKRQTRKFKTGKRGGETLKAERTTIKLPYKWSCNRPHPVFVLRTKMMDKWPDFFDFYFPVEKNTAIKFSRVKYPLGVQRFATK